LNKSKISIITVSYNSEKTIKETIESVNMQSFHDIEHIFVDGKSKDNTLEIINKNSRRNKVVICQKDEGLYDALNYGIKLASGDIIGILHSDDMFLNKDIVKSIYEVFEKYNCDLVWGNVKIVENGRSRVHRLYEAKFNPIKSFNFGIMPPHPSIFLKAEVYKKHGSFNIFYKIASDYDLISRIFLDRDLKFKFIDKTIVEMKTGGKSSESFKSILKLNSEILSINKHNGVQISLKNFIIKTFIRLFERFKYQRFRNMLINKYFKIKKDYYA
tara:strand:- start:798 stop:1613 length:816 start_codon:yes stop_codon:yes gene_type:complete